MVSLVVHGLLGVAVVWFAVASIVLGYYFNTQFVTEYATVSSLFTSCAFAYAFYFATIERQRRQSLKGRRTS